MQRVGDKLLAKRNAPPRRRQFGERGYYQQILKELKVNEFADIWVHDIKTVRTIIAKSFCKANYKTKKLKCEEYVRVTRIA